MLRILIVDNDRQFKKGFSEYLGSYSSQFTVKAVGREELNYQKPARIVAKHDLVLCDELFEDLFLSEIAGEEGMPEKLVILTHGLRKDEHEARKAISHGTAQKRFSERRIEVAGGSAGSSGQEKIVDEIAEDEAAILEYDAVRRVYKFRSAAEIVRDIPALAAFSEGSGKRVEGKMMVLAVTGYTGGCGKTSFAMSVARIYSRVFEKNALVLTADTISDLYDYFPQKPSEDTAGLNMLLLKFAGGTPVDPKEFLIRDGYGVYGFPFPSQGTSDLGDLSAEEFEEFMDFIESWKLFDVLILDMNAAVNARNLAVYRRADRIIMLHDVRRRYYRAENQWYRELDAELGSFMPIRVNTFCRDRGPALKKESHEDRNEETYSDEYRIFNDPDSFYLRDGIPEIDMTGLYMTTLMEICRSFMSV